MKLKNMPHPNQEYMQKMFTYNDGRLYRESGKLAGYFHKHNKKHCKGRFEVKIKTKNFLNSRLIWIYHKGDIPESCIIDHIDSDSTNDRIENLQAITIQQNNIKRNITKKPTGYRGVTLVRGKFLAKICKDYNVKVLGLFDTAEEAAKAYDDEASIIFDNFVEYNFSR